METLDTHTIHLLKKNRNPDRTDENPDNIHVQ